VKTVLLISAKAPGISAGKVRMRYFRWALEENGYKVVEFEVELVGFKKYLSYFLRTPPKGLIAKSKDTNVVVATVPPILNAIIGYKIAEKQGIPLIVDVKDVWEEYAKIAHSFMYNIGIIPKLVKEYYEVLKYSSKVIVVTEHMKQYYEKILEDENKIILISNGTDPDIIKPLNEKERRERDLVYMADFNRPYHNLKFLFEALKDGDLSLTVIGGGSYLFQLKNVVKYLGMEGRVVFTGWIPYEKLSSYLCRSKVGVVGRPFENNIGYLYTIPVKLYDYIAAGLPVVGYGPPGSALEFFIKENKIGTYVNQPNPEILLNELTKLVREHEKYIKKARALAINFDRRKLAQKLVKVINSLLNCEDAENK